MKLIKLLRDKRGDITYTDTAIATLVIMIVVAMALNVFSFFTLRQNLEYFCEQLIEEAACDGRIDDGVPERFIELCAELGFDEGDVSYSFDGSVQGYGSNGGLESIYQSPKFRRLYLRRLRTLMDEILKTKDYAAEQADITDAYLLAVAGRFGIGTAKRVLSEVRAAVG